MLIPFTNKHQRRQKSGLRSNRARSLLGRWRNDTAPPSRLSGTGGAGTTSMTAATPLIGCSHADAGAGGRYVVAMAAPRAD